MTYKTTMQGVVVCAAMFLAAPASAESSFQESIREYVKFMITVINPHDCEGDINGSSMCMTPYEDVSLREYKEMLGDRDVPALKRYNDNVPSDAGDDFEFKAGVTYVLRPPADT